MSQTIKPCQVAVISTMAARGVGHLRDEDKWLFYNMLVHFDCNIDLLLERSLLPYM